MRMLAVLAPLVSLAPLVFLGCNATGPMEPYPPMSRISAPQSAMVGELVTLSASGSSGDGPLTYAWELTHRPAGSTASITGATLVEASLLPDVQGEYVIRLVVSDGERESMPAEHRLMAFSESLNARHVNGSHVGEEDGTAARPFTTIQAALDLAEDGDTVKVAQGTYEENLVMPSDRGVMLLGGYPSGDFINRSPDNHLTRIRGDRGSAVITLEYTGETGEVHLLRIDGFTITGGQRGVLAESMGNGGVMSLALNGNVIEDNSGLTGEGDYGGGVLSWGMVPEITNNVIRENQSGKGGGLTVLLRSSAHEIRVVGNLIEDNSIHSDHGGGVYIAAYRGRIANNIIRGNRILESWGWGGGMIIDGDRFTGFSDAVYLELFGNVYTENEAPSGGSGLFIDEGANVRMSHERIFQNASLDSVRNGGLYVDGPRGSAQARTVIDHSTIVDNTAPEGSQGHGIYVEGGSEVIVTNSIFWTHQAGGESDFYVHEDSSLTVTYSLYLTGVSGSGSYVEEHILQTDPLFADPTNGDYHLRSQGGRWSPAEQDWVTDTEHSPAIDAGDPAAPYAEEPAPNGARANLGAFGNTPFASKSP